MRPLLRLSLGVLAILLPLARGVAEPGRPQVPEGAAATVNGSVIPIKAVREIVAGVAAVRPDVEKSEQRTDWERTALESLIEFELLYQEAKRQGVGVSAEEVDQEVERTKRKFAGERAYAAALAERGWTRADVRADTERSLVVQRFLETVVWKQVHVSPAAVEEFYRRNQEQFRHPAQVRLHHVLVRPSGNSREAWTRAEQEAQAARLRWQQEKGSEKDASHGNAEGVVDLGWVGPGELPPEFEATVFSLETGGVSPPLKREDGFYLFRVSGRRPEGLLPLEEVRPKIAAVLRKYERQRLRDELVARLRKAADIRYRDTTR